MEKFINIERARISDFEIADGVILKRNVSAFEPGDHIQVTEKIDGANARIVYNEKADGLDAFSPNKAVTEKDDFRGFWRYVRGMEEKMLPAFREHPNYLCFGEWEVPHTMPYRGDVYEKWYMYDIYDMAEGKYLPQDTVKAFAKDAGAEYIHEIFNGAFKSWEKVEGFMKAPSAYGEAPEGIVIKNQSKLNTEGDPFYVKIVNDEFKETKLRNHMKKVDDPNRIKETDEATELMADIVTMARIRKKILKMVDEGMLPNEITPEHMGIIAKNLPQMVYDDCVKEEKEVVDAAGRQARKACQRLTMQLARELILGEKT